MIKKNQSMSGFVYIWHDKKHNKFYIGSHWGPEDDGYICSSSWMKQAYKKRPGDFKRRILKVVTSTRKDLLLKEEVWLDKIKREELGKRYYNLCKGKTGHWFTDADKSLTISEKISKAVKKAFENPEIKQRYMDGRKNLPKHSKEVIEKRRQIMIATMEKKFPKEFRRKRLSRNSPELNEVYRQKSLEMWKNRSEEDKQAIALKISATKSRHQT